MNKIKLYGVEHCRIDGVQTYEIFRTLEDAERFVANKDNWDYNNMPLYIFSSDFNKDCVYEEEKGHLNYEDYADTLQGNFVILKELGKKPGYFEE